MTNSPNVVFWYNVYLWILAIMYVVLACAGIALLLLPAEILDMEKSESTLPAIICIAVAVPLAIASLLPFAFQPKPWLWIYGIVMIAIGLTSCCFWPICIPLLVFWIKRDVQIYFGRSV